jgi:hypothetical protein
MATRISTSTVQSFLASDLSIMQFAILGALVVHTTDQANFSFPYSDIFEDINTLTPQAFVNRINLRFTNFAQIQYGLDVTNGAPLVFSLDNEGYLCQELAAGWSLAGYYTNLEYLTNIIDHIDILTSLGVTVNTTDVVNHGYSQTREELIFWVSPPGYNGFLDFILLQDGVEVGRVHQDAAIGDNVEIEVFCAKLKTSLEQAFTGQNISVNYTIGDINPQGKIGGIFSVKFAKEALYQAKIILVETAHGDTGEVNFPPQPYTTDNLRYPFWMDTARNYTIGSVDVQGVPFDVQGVPLKFFRLRNNDITQTNHRVELIPVGNAKLTAKPNSDGMTDLDSAVITNMNPGWGLCLTPLPACDCGSDTVTMPIDFKGAIDSKFVFEATINGDEYHVNDITYDGSLQTLLTKLLTATSRTGILLSSLIDITIDQVNNRFVSKNKTAECLHDIDLHLIIWDNTGNNILGVTLLIPPLSLCEKKMTLISCAGANESVVFRNQPLMDADNNAVEQQYVIDINGKTYTVTGYNLAVAMYNQMPSVLEEYSLQVWSDSDFGVYITTTSSTPVRFHIKAQTTFELNNGSNPTLLLDGNEGWQGPAASSESTIYPNHAYDNSIYFCLVNVATP